MFPMTFAAINRRDWVFLAPYLSRSYGIHTGTRPSGQIASQRMFWEWEDAPADAGLPPLDQIPEAP